MPVCFFYDFSAKVWWRKQSHDEEINVVHFFRTQNHYTDDLEGRYL